MERIIKIVGRKTGEVYVERYAYRATHKSSTSANRSTVSRHGGIQYSRYDPTGVIAKGSPPRIGPIGSKSRKGRRLILAFINALRTILLVTSSIFPSIALLTMEQHFYPSFLRVKFSKDRSVRRNIDFSKIRDGMNLEIFLNLKISLKQRFSKIAIFVN